MDLNAIYEALLIITFGAHYAFVMLLIGVPLFALAEAALGRTSERGPRAFLRHEYPICISMTITTGVAPLLFSQTLLHGYFYQAFINLYPLPLIGLVLLTIFFYNAYLIAKLRRFEIPLTFIQVGLLLCFVLFFSMLFRTISHPAEHDLQFWSRTFPPLNWPRVALHFTAGLIGTGIFMAARNGAYPIRAIPLLVIGLGMGVYREKQRTALLGDDYPTSLQTSLDPSAILFVVSLIGIIIILIRAFRTAGLLGSPGDSPPAATPAATEST